MFQQVNNVEVLDLNQNQLAELHLGVFNGTSIIQSIILNNNYFHSIASCTFGALKHVEVLLVAENRLTLFGNNLLCGRNIKQLNVSNNPLSSVDKRAFIQSDSHLTLLDATPLHLCCFLPNVKSCSPRKTFFISSCRNLIRGLSLQLLYWFSGATLLVITLFTVAWLSHQIRSTEGGLNINILLLALFLSHLYFAFYFLIIAFANSIWDGYYSLYEDMWRTHFVCIFCNGCSFASYHSATFISLVISAVRMIATLYPFKARTLPVVPQVIAIIVWFNGVLIAGYLVTFFTDHSSHPDSALGLGLLLPVRDTKVPRWTFALFVAPNVLMQIGFAFCQCMTIFKLRRTSEILKSNSSVSKKKRGVVLSLITLIVVILGNIPLLSMHVLGMTGGIQVGMQNLLLSVIAVTMAIIPISNFVLYIITSRNMSSLLSRRILAPT